MIDVLIAPVEIGTNPGHPVRVDTRIDVEGLLDHLRAWWSLSVK